MSCQILPASAMYQGAAVRTYLHIKLLHRTVSPVATMHDCEVEDGCMHVRLLWHAIAEAMQE